MRARALLHLALGAAALVSGACGGEAPDDDALCGDGILAPTEACDDGDLDPGDGCDPMCRVEAGWFCEMDGSCRTPCGDGIVAGMEACDDGNQTSGDGCSETCANEAVIGRFSPVTGADPLAAVVSREVEVNVDPGILVTASLLGRFDERIIVDGTERGATARVARGSRVAIRMSAPPEFAANRSTELLVEGLRLEWRVSTRTSTFAWQTGPFGPCSETCGEGVRVREVTCVDELDRAVDDALCPEPAPPSAEICTDTSGCSYAYGPWTPWSACMNDIRTRSRPCVRQDGVMADCRFCGGDCAGTSACDVVCDRLGGSVVICGPTPPGDEARCNMSLGAAVARCRDAGCALTVDSSTVCAVGGFPGVPQCYGGRADCE